MPSKSFAQAELLVLVKRSPGQGNAFSRQRQKHVVREKPIFMEHMLRARYSAQKFTTIYSLILGRSGN